MKFKNSGKVLRKFRQEKQMSQFLLAKKLGIHSQYCSNVERGLCFYPKAKLKKLKKALNLDYGKMNELAYEIENDYKAEAKKQFKEIWP